MKKIKFHSYSGDHRRKMSRARKEIRVCKTHKQKGAALIIVLLLVATLSVIAVGLTEQTNLSAARSRNDFARSQLIWHSFSAEVLASRLLSDALNLRPNIMSLDDPWAVESFDLSALAVNQGESGEIIFADANRCFNLNSLLTPNNDDQSTNDEISVQELRINEFVMILNAVGVTENDARQLAIVIIDWLDSNGDPGPGGAEDNRYLRLPAPYRPANNLIADKSELRTMMGVSQSLMAAIAPYVCAGETSDPHTVNINMLRPQDAPILVGVFQGAISLNDAALLIERRPPGGYETVNDLLSSPIITGLSAPPALRSERLSTRSMRLQARINLVLGKTLFQSTVLFNVARDNQLTVLSRRYGSD